ncbi:C40 family peptidase [Ferruginibacter sp. SUN002]|uniref:C40 family peptidase n=1 Tax=Ferruginibacter sp. SUN002 TaxID=2937789 RepID=UPI003D368A8B
MKNFIAGLLVGGIITVCCFVFLKEGPAVQVPVYPAADSISAIEVINKKIDTVVPRTIHTNISSAQQDIINRDSLVSFAKTLLGVPYLYGSTDPSKGFDCSGFITYVFNHFKINVPRSSYDFEKIGKQKDLSTCTKGDLILFRGTNPKELTIGHIGIVIDIINGKPSFIHSSSGKVNSVTITSMESVYYQSRFVSVIDVLTK